MAGTHRTAIDSVASPVVDELAEHIRRYDFLAAVRLLECANPGKSRVGNAKRLQKEVVRLSQRLTLGFQGQALHSIERGQGELPPRMYVNFLGLFGSQGPLPLHLSEYADQRARHHADPTFREFLDLFHHRLLSLFYKASVRFDPVIGADRPNDNLMESVLAALAGVMPDASRARDSLPEQVRRYYPAWYGSRSRSPDGLVSLIRDQFKLPVRISEFVGGWLALDDEARARLGQRKVCSQLGMAMYIGRRVWSVRHRFCIHLGPLNERDFQSFKPGSTRAARLHDLVRFYTGDEWDWDLELQVQHTHRQSMRLDRTGTLGFDCWLGKAHRAQQARASRVRINRSALPIALAAWQGLEHSGRHRQENRYGAGI